MSSTAQEILKMTSADAAKLAPGDLTNAKKKLMAMAKLWHPDISSDPMAKDVFQHIIQLKNSVEPRKKKPVVQRILKTKDGKRKGISPLSSTGADQGEILLNRRTIATIFPKAYADLGQREADAISNFKFADSKMEEQMSYSLPKLLDTMELEDGSFVVITQKGDREILLSDLLAKRGSMPDVHAAWLCSGLMNICAWLQFAELAHGAISPENILIDPEKHSVRLATGWAFSTPVGSRPTALPSRTLSVTPRMAIKDTMADTMMDRNLVRQTVRDALADPRGTSGAVNSLPSPVSGWINLPPAKSAFEDYANWQKALEEGWGKRKFVVYPISANDIY